MHPVSQMIQPMLKEALPRPTVRANSRQENKAHYDVLMLSKNVTSVCFFFFFFWLPLVIQRSGFPAECGMRDAVSGAALIPWLSLASRRPRCSPINTYSITMHPTSHSRCGPCAGGKREGERQGERRRRRRRRRSDRGMEPREDEMMFYRQTRQNFMLRSLLRTKGGIMRCNKKIPTAVKVNCSFSAALNSCIHFNKAATRKLISSPIKRPH